MGHDPIQNVAVLAGPKFRVCVGLAPHDRPDSGLRKTDDAILRTMDVVFVHIQLLLIERSDRIRTFSLPF